MAKFNSSIILQRDDLNKEVCGDKTQEPTDQQVFILMTVTDQFVFINLNSLQFKFKHNMPTAFVLAAQANIPLLNCALNGLPQLTVLQTFI